MLSLYGHHLVKDYESWKKLFDQDEKRRLSYGLKTKKIMRSADNENEVHFLFEVNDLKLFLQCINDPVNQQLMEEAGVLQKPVMNILKEI